MRKDREFNDVLNECLERLVDSGESVEQCLESYPEESTELEPLLRTALEVRKASAVQPSAEFKARARYQFHLALAELKPRRRLWEWRPRWVTAVALILVVLFAGSGMGVATYHSMPGQLLHPVRLTAEEIWLARTSPGIARAQIHAQLAARRVAEIVYLTGREDRSAEIEQVAQRLYYHLATIESLAAAETVVTRRHVVEEVRPMTGLEAPVVEVVVEKEGPGEIGPAGPAALLTAKKVTRWAQFRASLEQQAGDHLADLRNLLPVVSESARPALLTAIAVAEAGYERAIEGLE
ncbi:MAG TPA: hypothetical protein DCY61_05355 [Dehalococcoidia bacterium]|nr:hypothetical protein [Dehalococcoidia bacterium]